MSVVEFPTVTITLDPALAVGIPGEETNAVAVCMHPLESVIITV